MSTLRLLSWNIQCGIETARASEYLTRGWRHLLPHKQSPANLRRIAGLLTHFDVVALQEADGGSLRSGFFNQVEYLADMAGFPHWHAQRTRNLAQLGQHGNGLLSRYAVHHVVEHKLPGIIPGRGAIEARLGHGEHSLTLLVLHLSLGGRARRNQLEFLARSLRDVRHLIVMGDMNCEADDVQQAFARYDLPLQRGASERPTFPSWKPARQLDHILASSDLQVRTLEVLPYCYSDHLPVAMEVDVPGDVQLGPAGHRAPLAPAVPLRKHAAS